MDPNITTVATNLFPGEVTVQRSVSSLQLERAVNTSFAAQTFKNLEFDIENIIGIKPLVSELRSQSEQVVDPEMVIFKVSWVPSKILFTGGPVGGEIFNVKELYSEIRNISSVVILKDKSICDPYTIGGEVYKAVGIIPGTRMWMFSYVNDKMEALRLIDEEYNRRKKHFFVSQGISERSTPMAEG